MRFTNSYSCHVFLILRVWLILGFLLGLCLTTVNCDENQQSSTIAGQPDKFVSVAPLVVGAVCQDGVALVAHHVLEQFPDEEETQAHSEEIIHDEKDDTSLSAESNIDNKDNGEGVNDITIHQKTTGLPSYHRGPYRINPIDGFGTTLVCAGWRTDTIKLASKCRSLAATEVDRYGTPSNLRQYARFLSNEAAFWMAQCHASDGVRALSCAGLICSHDALWLVDATGSYRVRAHALGLGSKEVNEALTRTDFSKLTKEEGMATILRIVQEEQEKNTTGRTKPTHIETAVVDPASLSMKRMPFTVSLPKAAGSS
mmetsp:Transcript_63/g.130  ORF Transcript_63/g.130 Transcript_63/m.130 type:complete len:313 (-) Transcript_63:4231-5169(-)